MIQSFILLMAFILFFILIIEIFTVLFRIMGMQEDKAKFQVISLLTGVGYTTKESDATILTIRRRRLATITMLFGYTFSLIIVTLLLNFLMRLSKSELSNTVNIIFIILIVMTILYIFTKFRLKKYLDKMINKIYYSLTHDKTNPIFIIDEYNSKIMANVHLNQIPEELINIPLKKTKLKDLYSIQILAITRNQQLINHVDGDTILNEKDMLLVFGEEKTIYQYFK